MSNYLQHLAARSLAQADVIMPRPSSLFETAVSIREPNNLEEESFVEPRQTETPPPAQSINHVVSQHRVDDEKPPRTVALPPSNLEKMTPKTPPLPDWVLQLKSLIQQPPTVPPEMALPKIEIESEGTLRADASITPTPEPTAAVKQAAAPNQQETPSSIEPSIEQVIEHRQTETRLVFERMEQPPVISETVVERDVYPPVEHKPVPQPEKSAVIEPHKEEPKIVLTDTQPYTSPVPAQSIVRQQVAQTAPTINVTIGRVEVRATQSSNRSKKRPQLSQPLIMSLDEYLQQRSNGEKR
jgi:hypothetical protein